MMTDKIMMRNERPVNQGEGGFPNGQPTTPPLFTPINQFRAMSSQRPAHSSGALPPARRNKTMKPSKEMDMESIRARRAQLEALTARIKLPPLAPVGSPSLYPPSKLSHTSSRLYGKGDRYYRRRREPDRPPSTSRVISSSSSPRITSGTPTLPTLSLAPMTPYHNPLPNIGQEKLLEEDESVPEPIVDSPPPPTFEETVQVSKWVAQITTHEPGAETPPSPVPLEVSEYTLEEEEGAEEPKLEATDAEGQVAEVSSPATSPTEDNRPESAASTKSDDGNLDDKGDALSSASMTSEEKEQESYEEIVSLMKSDDLDVRHNGTRKARKVLSGSDPQIQGYLDAGILEPIIENMKIKENTDLQYEAAWVITNIASGTSEQTKAVVDNGAVEPLLDLMSSDHESLREQGLWALSNIVGDSPPLRDYVLKAGLLNILLDQLQKEQARQWLQNCAWLVCNLCRHKPRNYEKKELDAIMDATKILMEHTEGSTICDCLWALSYLSEDTDMGVQAIIDAGMVSTLVKFMSNREKKLHWPAIKACAGVTSGNDSQKETVLEAGALTVISEKLVDYAEQTMMDVLVILSNLTAGTKEQAQKVLDAGFLTSLIQITDQDSFLTRKKKIQVLSNLTSNGHKDHIVAVAEVDGIEAFLSMLGVTVSDAVQVSLNGLNNMLKASKEPSDLQFILPQVEELDGVDILETLTYHETPEVHQMARRILETYFPDIEKEEEQEEVDSFIVSSDNEDGKESAVTDQAAKYLLEKVESGEEVKEKEEEEEEKKEEEEEEKDVNKE